MPQDQRQLSPLTRRPVSANIYEEGTTIILCAESIWLTRRAQPSIVLLKAAKVGYACLSPRRICL